MQNAKQSTPNAARAPNPPCTPVFSAETHDSCVHATHERQTGERQRLSPVYAGSIGSCSSAPPARTSHAAFFPPTSLLSAACCPSFCGIFFAFGGAHIALLLPTSPCCRPINCLNAHGAAHARIHTEKTDALSSPTKKTLVVVSALTFCSKGPRPGCWKPPQIRNKHSTSRRGPHSGPTLRRRPSSKSGHVRRLFLRSPSAPCP